MNNLGNDHERVPLGAASSTQRHVNKIFVQRDYSEGLGVRFEKKYPRELSQYIDEPRFIETIETINSLFKEAEDISCTTFCESCCSCLTFYLLYLCIDTHYEKCLQRVATFVNDQNEKVYIPRGLHLTDPAENGLRVIEITINPHN